MHEIMKKPSLGVDVVLVRLVAQSFKSFVPEKETTENKHEHKRYFIWYFKKNVLRTLD